MTSNTEQPTPLVSQILNDMFAKVRGHAEFSEQLQGELKKLAEMGELKKAQRVIEVLKSSMEEST